MPYSPRAELRTCAMSMLVLIGTGCVEPRQEFPCDSAAQCQRGGMQGTCEATGYCSFLDLACVGGRRYGEGAPAHLRDQCVPDPCPAGALVCDDFEGTFAWTGMYGSAQVTSARPRDGSRSLEVEVPAAAPAARAGVFQELAVQDTGTLAVRLWMSAEIAASDGDRLVELSGPIMLVRASRMFVGAGLDGTLLVRELGTGGPRDHVGAVAVPSGAMWTCVELVYDLDTRLIQVFVDDQLAISGLAVDDAPSFSRVDVGIPGASGMGYHVFLDNVVVAPRRVGCR